MPVQAWPALRPVVLSISAWYLLKGRDLAFATRSFRVAAAFGLASVCSVIVLGDDGTLATAEATPAAYRRLASYRVFPDGHEAWGPPRRGIPSYVPPSAEGQWSPTPPSYAAPLLPRWGLNRPFALSSPQDCPAPPPPAYDESKNSAF